MSNKRGFTILELLVAIFILSVGILGAYVAIQKSASIAGYSYSRLTAAYLAQEAIEIVRNIKDTNLLEGIESPPNSWDEGFDGMKSYELEYLDGGELDPNISIKECYSPCEYESSSMHFLKKSAFHNYGSGSDTKFKRKVIVNVTPDESLEVQAVVYWKDGEKIKKFEAWENFYNWW